jgi:hypothetical protein
MAKSENSKEKNRFEIVKEEIEEFLELVKGHEKILQAIGRL